MKLANRFRTSSVLTLTAFGLFSCAPKDEKLIRPDTNTQFKTESIASDVSVKLAFAALDKTVEALMYLKALLNPTFALQKNLTIETVSQADNQTIVKIISSAVQNESDSFVQLTQVNLLAVITRNELQEIISVLIKDDSGGQAKTELFVKAGGVKSEKASVVLVQKSKRYLITKSSDANTYEIETDAVDSLKSFNRKNLNEVYSDALSQVFAKSIIAWDGKAESLDQKIQVVSTAPEYQPQLSRVRTQLKSNGPVDLSIFVGECTYLEGQVSLASVKVKADTVVENQVLLFSNTGVVVSGKPFKYKWADCKSRPTVDLTQLL